MGTSRLSYSKPCALAFAAMICAALLVGCGGGSQSTSNSPTSGPAMGTLNTSISDPPTCKAQFSHVYVTITKVRVHTSDSADANATGWTDVIDLTANPKQIDLLNLENTQCLFNQLGSKSLQAGKYQQIRVVLLANNATGVSVSPLGSNTAENACSDSAENGPFNCVVPDGGSPQELLLSSEAKTGIKIPSSQITQGGVTVPAGQTTDLDINFNTCSSVVHQGNGKYRLKPVLHAGEVALNNNSLSGRIVESGSSPVKPIAGAIVLFERADPNNADIDRVAGGTITGSDGTFAFCTQPMGEDFDLVAAAMTTDSSLVTTTYNATVTLKVPVGTAVGDIPLVPEPVTTTSSPITLQGLITTTTASSGGAETASDISLSALQSVGGGSSLLVTVPTFEGSTLPVISTIAAAICPADTDCANYTLLVPGSNPNVGTFSSSGTTYTAPAANPAIYWVNALATVPMSNPTTDNCSPSSFPATFDNSTQLSGEPGDTLTQDIAFTGCTSGF
jgi:Domain of unknown function (DUF4382)